MPIPRASALQRALSIAALCLLTSSPPNAGDAWFGQALPETRQRLSDRDRAAYLEPDLPALPTPAASAAGDYGRIRGEDIHADLREIVRITRANRAANERYTGRIAGNAAELATADFIAARFEDYGLANVRTEPVEGGRQWWPEDWEVTLIGDESFGAGTDDYTFGSAFPAVQLHGNPMDIRDLQGELVYVGLARPVDLVGRDLRGRIAVVRSLLQPDPFFQTARGHIEALVEAGAAAVLIAVDGPGNHQYALEEMGSDEAPCFLLGGHDGRFLEDVMAAAGAERPLSVRIAMRASVRDHWNGRNVIGEIPGRSEDTLLITAHLDGYFDGANDNAGGLASMLALARHFADRKPRLKVVFIGTSGHHEFSDGARAFIAMHPGVLSRSLLVLNIEHPSSVLSYFRGPLRISRGTVPGQLMTTNAQAWRTLTVSNGDERLLDWFRAAAGRHGVVVERTMSRRPNGDAFDFFRAGVPIVQLMDANVWFHSSGDSPDTIDPAGLERTTRLYAEVIERIDGSDMSVAERRDR